MGSPQRLAGVSRQTLDAHRPGEEWEQLFAPADFVAGPVGTDITYLPSGRIGVKLVAGASSGQAFSIKNPYPVDCFVSSLWVNVTTAGKNQQASINLGIVASSSKTASNLGLGIGVGSVAIVPVVAGGADLLWKKAGSSSDSWLTGLRNDGCSSLAGQVIIDCVPLYSS